MAYDKRMAIAHPRNTTTAEDAVLNLQQKHGTSAYVKSLQTTNDIMILVLNYHTIILSYGRRFQPLPTCGSVQGPKAKG